LHFPSQVWTFENPNNLSDERARNLLPVPMGARIFAIAPVAKSLPPPLPSTIHESGTSKEKEDLYVICAAIERDDKKYQATFIV
jgi:hypothetical protein